MSFINLSHIHKPTKTFPMKKNPNSKKAFTFNELSIIILAISLMLGAIPAARSLLRNQRLAAAQTLTNNSPAQNIAGLAFWFETSRIENFLLPEAKGEKNITIWKDSNPQSTTKLDAIAASAASGDSAKFYYNVAVGANTSNTTGPTYIKNGINYLPTLRFENANAAFNFLTIDEKFSVDPLESMTMFFVFNYGGGEGFLIDRICRNSSGATVADCSNDAKGGLPFFAAKVDSSQKLWFFAKSDNGEFGSIGADGFDSGYTLQAGKTYVVTLEREFGQTFSIYVNGTSILSKSDSSGTNSKAPISLAPFRFGRHFNNTSGETLNFDLSEVLFFNQAIRTEDRDSIEGYLGKKYNVKIN